MTTPLDKYENLPAWATVAKLAFHFQLDEPTPSNNVIKAMHFHTYKKTRQDWQGRVLAAYEGVRPSQALERAAIVVVRGSAGQLDWDNAYGGLKPVLDCLVLPSKRNPSGLGFIVDDNPGNMPEPPYVRQLRAKRGAGFTEIFVFAV